MALSAYFLFFTFGGSKEITKAYFWDAKAKEIFVDDIDRTAPFKRSNGNEAVRVYIYSCGACDESEWFKGYYSRQATANDPAPKSEKKADESGEDPAAKTTADADEDADGLTPDEMSKIMYSADGVTWVRGETPQHTAILVKLMKKCGKGKTPLGCLP